MLSLFFSSASLLFAQQRLFTNQQLFTVEDGLPQNFISGIMQDSDGFIWLSTMDGLSRYDGRGFKNIRYNPKDTNGLFANVINNIGRFRNNTITIHYGTNEADDFNLRTFKAKRNKAADLLNKIPYARWQPFHVGYTTSNWLFIMSNNKGMGWLDSKTGQVHYANKVNGLLQQDTINAVVESNEGKLYLVSTDGVHISDTSRSKFQWMRFTTHVKKEVVLASELSERFSIVCLPGDRLIVAQDNKIILLDTKEKISRFIPAPANLQTALAPLNCELQVDAKGRAYFENSGRIFRITESGEMKMLWENTINPSLRISAFFIDRSDVLWVSINAQGLLKIDLQSAPFESYKYRTNFIADILEHAGVRLTMPLNQQTKGEASYYLRQAIDKKNNHFIFSGWLSAANVFQLSQTKLHPFFQFPPQYQNAALINMPNGALWLLSQDQPSWYFWKSNVEGPEKVLIDPELSNLVEINDAKYFGGSVWMATYKHGLLQYTPAKKVNRFSGQLKNGVVPESLTEFCADPVDTTKFWIGSRGGGLILWDVQKGLQKIYTEEDGLPNNTIYCILPDNAGNIWCSTNKGIFRFNRRTGQVTTFEKTDGLPGNEFNRSHKFMFADGRLAFGGLDGFTIFNPADFNSDAKKTEVPVLLTGLQINNQQQDFNIDNSFVKEPISIVSDIELPYNKNNLRFEFAALLYNQPQKIKYRYQLKGADNDWIENGTSNVASYAALRPGTYTFLINASDQNGLWADTVKEISIRIRPPFWATWWAYIVYALIALALLKWYFNFREGKLKAEQNFAFEKREALRLREVDELKDRFFSNITHEFRTPLTLILTPLEKLEHDPSLSAAAVSNVKTAQRNSKQLLQLINEFLDFSKLNNGQLQLKTATGDLALFTTECVKSFETAANEKNISLLFSANAVDGFYLFDEEKWNKIVWNLLSNALKFTPANGVVSVSLYSSDKDHIHLEVKDNGPGIALHHQQKIFDRFYQVDDSAIRTFGGTGIGLSLVKELTELMDGTIKLRSELGVETCFTVSVPMKKMMTKETAGAVHSSVSSRPITAAEQELPLLLVAEDNDELRSFLVETMQSHYRVLEAADGLKAWEIILQELPDIVISDVMMPGQDGFDLCSTCKADNRTAHIGFILLTSKAAHDARLKGLGTGADDYITKPFHLQELELRTANILQTQKKQRAWLQARLINTAPQEQLPEITDPFLIALYKEMDAKLDDADLNVDHLCKTMAMSRSTLNRKLKSLLDISPNELIKQYRLQKGSQLISAGLDISTAAYQVGFSSPSYFSQCFKEQYGITPSEFVLKLS
ncbi:hybrid sensor histidine kinase/response regulator transcription factor [Lacibacter luteus]|uniref:hybrid sensor histidine kinase/response regulator transcription factor n=1 Tax=Lacibacter luteus TaxID=2508719 RepID=UPI0013E92181|nr:hybrid sensor histidine kinase/response regulator transcription factor [Lacibacter luteus]